MHTRALVLIVGLLLAGCATAGVPATSSAPAETIALSTAEASPTQSALASPAVGACDAGDDPLQTAQTVPATANIFGAGRDAAPAPGDGGGGTLPPVWELPSGSTVVTFPCATGEVTPYTGQSLRNGPAGDRAGAGGVNTDVASYAGISGIVNRGNGMFLVAVFLTDAEAADPAPERLDFTDGEDFNELAPEIGQTFLVGDGVGRSYRVPPGATRLFAGFADAFEYEGAPGWYGNNAGELQVAVAVEAD